MSEPRTVTIAVLTVSATKSLETDTGGALLCARVEALGHRVLKRLVLPPSRDAVEAQLRAWVTEETVDVILVTGGIGPLPSDVVPEAVRAVIDRELPGIGEEVRRVRREREGLRALLDREIGGVAGNTFVLAVGESAAACRVAWDVCLGALLDPESDASLVSRLVELSD
ncbi:MAG: molybdenum cofactor biosynthesis protein B [Sandaracinaceae bacterium]